MNFYKQNIKTFSMKARVVTNVLSSFFFLENVVSYKPTCMEFVLPNAVIQLGIFGSDLSAYMPAYNIENRRNWALGTRSDFHLV
jgi:hypothetical protein